MLLQRVVTAVVLLAVLLPALFAPMAWPFAVLTLVLIAAAGWEWSRLNGLPGAGAVAFGVLIAGACAAAIAARLHHGAPVWIWWAATLAWVLGGSAVLRLEPAAWPSMPRALRLVGGGLLLWTAWLALAQARGIGLNFILSVFCLVWIADIAAYFGGKTFGRRKLAPRISPGKSWEGAVSGMLAVLLLAFLWAAADRRFALDSPSLYSLVQSRIGALGLALVAVFLAAMSIVGDLFESLVKRSVGAKDSSRLLPGHGGVLDRIDALLPVFPIALAMASL